MHIGSFSYIVRRHQYSLIAIRNQQVNYALLCPFLVLWKLETEQKGGKGVEKKTNAFLVSNFRNVKEIF